MLDQWSISHTRHVLLIALFNKLNLVFDAKQIGNGFMFYINPFYVQSLSNPILSPCFFHDTGY